MSTLKRYVSAVTSLDQREITPHIIGVENNVGLTDVLGAFGRYKPSKMYKVESFVDEQLWQQGTSTGSVTGSGTATITTTLTTATSKNRRANDLVTFPNGLVGKVRTATYAGADVTLVIDSVNGTNLTFVTGNSLRFFSNAVGEKSISRASQVFLATHYYNLLQIFRETHETSDVQLLSYVEAPKSGVWTYKEYAEKFIKHKAEVNAAFIQGQISASQFSTSTNALNDNDGGGITQTGRGLRQYISSYGVNDTVASSGSWTLNGDCADMIQLLIAKKASGNFKMYAATAPLGKVDDHLKNLGSGGVTSARMNLDGKSVNYMVDTFNYRGFGFQKMLLPILNQPDLFGTTELDNGIFYVPDGGVRTVDANGESTYHPRIQVRYKPQPRTLANKGNDIWAESHTGMYSKVNPEGSVAKAEVNWLTAQCLEVLGAQHFGFQGNVGRS